MKDIFIEYTLERKCDGCIEKTTRSLSDIERLTCYPFNERLYVVIDKCIKGCNK